MVPAGNELTRVDTVGWGREKVAVDHAGTVFQVMNMLATGVDGDAVRQGCQQFGSAKITAHDAISPLRVEPFLLTA